MTTSRPTAQHQRSGNRLRGGAARLARFVVPGVIGLLAIVGLGVGAVHGARQASSLSGTANVHAWQDDSLYWDCLDAQAHSLVKPGEHVWIANRSLAKGFTLQKVLSPWAIVVRHSSEAETWVSLEDAKGPGTCLGTVLQGRYPGPSGTETIVRTGTGGAFPGHRSLPSTPL